MNTVIDSDFFITKSWIKNKNTIWLTSQMRLFRNLKTHPFPDKLSPLFLKKLSEMLRNILLNCSTLKESSFHFISDLTLDDKKRLHDYFLMTEEYFSLDAADALVLDQSKRFHALVNVHDHLVLSLIDEKNQLEQAWNKLLKIETQISKQIEFAFSSRFGFLTSNINRCGTALHLETFLHLPALIYSKKLESCLNKIPKHLLKWTSFLSHDQKFLGDIVILSNLQTIGISEENLINVIQSQTLNLVIAEREMRQQLQECLALKDKVSKAYGSLKHAFQLDASEALSLLSLCKLGVELDWIKGLALQDINELIFITKNDLIQLMHHGKEIDTKKLRAHFILKKIKKASI